MSAIDAWIVFKKVPEKEYSEGGSSDAPKDLDEHELLPRETPPQCRDDSRFRCFLDIQCAFMLPAYADERAFAAAREEAAQRLNRAVYGKIYKQAYELRRILTQLNAVSSHSLAEPWTQHQFRKSFEEAQELLSTILKESRSEFGG